MTMDFSRELEIAIALARQAGQAILEASLHHDAFQISEKWLEHGQSTTPVTSADFVANRIICNRLKITFPDHALLSEEIGEGISDAAWYEAEYAWIVDPLDGTESYIQGGKDFGVHLGLTARGNPVLGVNYYPATDVIYWAVNGQGAWKQQSAGEKRRLYSRCPEGDFVLQPLMSKSDLVANSVFERLVKPGCSSVGYVGSTGLRLCAIAEGSYNVYLASARRAGLWDFLSGEVILREAGCLICDWAGKPIDYRRKDARLPTGVVVCGSQQIYDCIMEQLNDESLAGISQVLQA